jgi:hypothetical protein
MTVLSIALFLVARCSLVCLSKLSTFTFRSSVRLAAESTCSIDEKPQEVSESMNQTVFTPHDHDYTIYTTITNYSQPMKKK